VNLDQNISKSVRMGTTLANYDQRNDFSGKLVVNEHNVTFVKCLKNGKKRSAVTCICGLKKEKRKRNWRVECALPESTFCGYFYFCF
jgi:acetone carboxylase gamma subunit